METRPNPLNIPIEPIPPDLLEWARQTLDVDEMMADIGEIERTGGVKFEDLIAEIDGCGARRQ